jgi:hypothetical protein
MTIQFHAQIPVHEAGYRWVAEGGNLLAIVAPVERDRPEEETPSQDKPYRYYDPFETEPALFQIFADLDPVDVFSPKNSWALGDESSQEASRFREAVLGFVNKYGVPAIGRPAGFLTQKVGGYEIAQAILEMRVASNLWQVTRGDMSIVQSLTQQYRACNWEPMGQVQGSDFVAGMLERALTSILQSTLSPERTKDALMALETGIAERAHYEAEFFRPHPALLALQMRAETLLAAMWLQLAMAIVENKEFRRCEFCGRPFEVGKRYHDRQGRRDKVFCSDSCRVKSCSRRKAQARTMREGGASLREIAKAVESKVGTVKGWLGEE